MGENSWSLFHMMLFQESREHKSHLIIINYSGGLGVEEQEQPS